MRRDGASEELAPVLFMVDKLHEYDTAPEVRRPGTIGGPLPLHYNRILRHNCITTQQCYIFHLSLSDQQSIKRVFVMRR